MKNNTEKHDVLEERRKPNPGERGLLDDLEDGQSTARLVMVLAAAALGAAALVAIIAG